MLVKRGIKIDGLHTGKDLDFLLISYSVGNPEVKTYAKEIPGRDGLLDCSEWLDNKIHYGNRLLSFRFFITANSKEELKRKLDRINEYHGRYIKKLFITDDKEYYYQGRATVAIEEEKGKYAYVIFELNAQPYKLKKDITVASQSFSAKTTLALSCSPMPTVPTAEILFTTPSGSGIAVRITSGDKTAIIQENIKTELSNFVLNGNTVLILETVTKQDDNWVLDEKAGAAVTFKYQEGRI